MSEFFCEDKEIVFDRTGTVSWEELFPPKEGHDVVAALVSMPASGGLLTVSAADPAAARKEFLSLFRMVEAAGGLVRDGENEVLMIHRNGRWDLPKGHVEQGEDPAAAAVREVEEETGVRATVTGPLVETCHFYRLQGSWVMKMTHWFTMEPEGESECWPQVEEGIAEAVWVPSGEAALKAAGCFPSVARVLSHAGITL